MPLPDIDDFTATFGGSKQNYSPVEDPTTDEDAAVRNQYVADVAMATATLPRGLVRFTSAATTGAMVLVSHNAVWGNVGVTPTLAHSATGILTITFPTSVNDALGIAHTVNIRTAFAQHRAAGTYYTPNAVPTSANVITVYVGLSGSANDAVGVDFDVVYY